MVLLLIVEEMDASMWIDKWVQKLNTLKFITILSILYLFLPFMLATYYLIHVLMLATYFFTRRREYDPCSISPGENLMSVSSHQEVEILLYGLVRLLLNLLISFSVFHFILFLKYFIYSFSHYLCLFLWRLVPILQLVEYRNGICT